MYTTAFYMYVLIEFLVALIECFVNANECIFIVLCAYDDNHAQIVLLPCHNAKVYNYVTMHIHVHCTL